MDTVNLSIDEEFDRWLERVHATHAAVLFTCTSRLRGDRTAAAQVAVQVLAGLVSRPSIFRYFGLPFSGRIARLAETRLAEAAAGELATVCGWQQLWERLESIPEGHREILVATCVRGDDMATLATGLLCDGDAAASRHAATLRFMLELAAPGLPTAPNHDPAIQIVESEE
ncbi:MAG TPA: hypothetical protein VH084_11135 [Mycobacterium sp.]|jgi:hypothetical protein|nr:hypothetical protein [Mycobacterium sp.]